MHVKRFLVPTTAAFLVAIVVGCVGDNSGSTSDRSGVITGFDAGWDTGILSHDLKLTNKSGRDLEEVDVTITLYRTDGDRPEIKQFWAKWANGEVKAVKVAARQYQKVTLKGTAERSARTGIQAEELNEYLRKRTLSGEWTWDWGFKQK